MIDAFKKNGEFFCIEKYYSLAGFSISLRFAGEALIAGLTPALEHLRVINPNKVDLTIDIWDSVSTGVETPKVPWTHMDYRRRMEIEGFREGEHLAFSSHPTMFQFLDLKRDTGTFWVQSPEDIPYYVTATPFLQIFHAWASARGMQVVHAGAVGFNDGGVLVVGKSGSGKSTTCLSCLNSDLQYLADDYCLVGFEPTPTVYSIYNSGKKNADDIMRLPFLASSITNADRLKSEKAVYYTNNLYKKKIIPSCPIRAIIIPRVWPVKKTSLESAPKMEIMRSAATSTVMQLACAGKETFERIASLSRTLPCYYLNVGSDMSGISETLINLLASI